MSPKNFGEFWKHRCFPEVGVQKKRNGLRGFISGRISRRLLNRRGPTNPTNRFSSPAIRTQMPGSSLPRPCRTRGGVRPRRHADPPDGPGRGRGPLASHRCCGVGGHRPHGTPPHGSEAPPGFGSFRNGLACPTLENFDRHNLTRVVNTCGSSLAIHPYHEIHNSPEAMQNAVQNRQGKVLSFNSSKGAMGGLPSGSAGYSTLLSLTLTLDVVVVVFSLQSL